MLQIKNIKKQYQTAGYIQKALDDVSLNLRDNEFVAILGPSGSGKTTLLNIIGGLDRYDEGDLIINDTSTKRYHDRDWDSYRNHSIGFIFQSYNLIPHQNILANVELALTIGGISKSEQKERALAALEKVGLREQAHKKPNQLSGGQMQRVAIARALVNDPEIVLADEPTGALDSETGIQVMELLKEVAQDRLVVMVTHNPELAQQYATRIVKLKDGKIISDSNPYQEISLNKNNNQKQGKAGMNFLTALNLSFNNLWTKKARTFLVAFAGSIGIIGIALILSLSNGVNQYIDDTEEATLSQYPLEIEKSSFSLSSLLPTVSISEDSDEKVHEIAMVGSVFSTLSENDLYSFKEYLEVDSDIDTYAKSIEYKYDIEPIILRDDGDAYTKVNPLEVFDDSDSIVSLFTSNISSSYLSYFKQLPRETSLYEEQYELKAGRWPSSKEDCLLILQAGGGISDAILITMGLKTQEEAAREWDYEEFIDVEFLVLPASSFYCYDEQLGVYSDHSEDDSYIRNISSDGISLKLVGVAEVSADSSVAMLEAGLWYSPLLCDYLLEIGSESEIVQKQLANPKLNIFNGNNFDEEADNSLDFSSLFSFDQDKFQQAFGVDADALNIDTSALNNLDMESLLDTDLNNLNLNIDLAGLDIEFDGSKMQDTLTTLGNAYTTYAQKDKNTDFTQFDNSFKQYLNSDDFNNLLSEEINKLIRNNASNFLTAETLKETVSAVMSGYENYDKDPNLSFNENLNNYLNSDVAQDLLATQLSKLLSSMISDIDLNQDVTNEIINKISASYSDYATANNLPIPSKMAANFSEFMGSTEARDIIVSGLKNSFNSADLMQQLNALIEQGSNNLKDNLNVIMANLMNNIADEIAKMLRSTMSSLPNALYINEEVLATAFQINMDENELQSLLKSMLSTSSSTLENNLATLGYVAENDLNEIIIYPYDFDSKQAITKIIDEYNSLHVNDSEKQIIYADLVGVMMSSVSDIVNVISYVLIAFVAISLIVSSIMIGVITYISVLERQKEIGILRAMGASKANIANIFNAETFITGLLAGILGILISNLLLIPGNTLIHYLTGSNEINAFVSLKASLILIILATILTMLGGLLPARKASKSDPVTALRLD